jgi:glycosyltransferase involved in cell wall biosynthesis
MATLRRDPLQNELTLNIVQDLATPHNNSLVRALRQYSKYRIITWYAMQICRDLPWEKGLGGDVDNYYFDNWPDRLRLMKRVLFRSNQKFMVIGYANFGTRFILVASWLLGRRFIYWTDHPAEKQRSPLRAILNRVALGIVRRAGNPVFVVGRHVLDKFRQLGFDEKRLVNLPIFIDLPERGTAGSSSKSLIRERFQVASDQVLFAAASRFTYEKGFDLLIEAVATLPGQYVQALKLLIIGTGPEYERLLNLVRRYGLDEHVTFVNWLSPEDYEHTISASDVFIHPARFDAFGGGTLYAMALGVPVIGSSGAGAVLERVEHEKTGLVYEANDIQGLAGFIMRLIDAPGERQSMGVCARLTAEKWPPSIGAQIIENSLSTHLVATR